MPIHPHGSDIGSMIDIHVFALDLLISWILDVTKVHKVDN